LKRTIEIILGVLLVIFLAVAIWKVVTACDDKCNERTVTRHQHWVDATYKCPAADSAYTSTDNSKDCKRKINDHWRYADQVVDIAGHWDSHWSDWKDEPCITTTTKNCESKIEHRNGDEGRWENGECPKPSPSPTPEVTPTPTPEESTPSAKVDNFSEPGPASPPPACVAREIKETPTVLELKRIDKDTIFVSWSPVDEGIGDYIVWYGPSENAMPFNLKVHGLSTEINGAVGSTWVAVQGTDNCGVGSLSAKFDP